MAKRKGWRYESNRHRLASKGIKTKCHLFLKKASIPDSKFNRKQLNEGIKVENEHTDNREIAEAIAKAHLSEDRNYYIKLKKAGL